MENKINVHIYYVYILQCTAVGCMERFGVVRAFVAWYETHYEYCTDAGMRRKHVFNMHN